MKMTKKINLPNFNFKNILIGIYIIWYREILIYVRNREKFFTSIFLPLLLTLIFGTGLKNIFPMTNLPYDFSEFFFSGILGASITTLAITSTMSIVWDREFGFLKEILVSPISRSSIALGKILGATTTALIEGLLLLLVAPSLNLHLSFISYLMSAIIIFLISFGMASLGLIIASNIKKTESFNIIIQVLIAPLVFLSGAFFPVNNGPFWILKLSHYNPLTYGINALRWMILSQKIPTNIISNFTTNNLYVSLLICIVFDMIISLIAIYRFKQIR
jgi:ABC-2 type transport system permease protein